LWTLDDQDTLRSSNQTKGNEMSKLTKRQQSLVYWAQAVQEWRAKGWSKESINLMLIRGLHGCTSVHPAPNKDAVLVLEIADGTRCA
jgi:hypothetical protein